VTVPCTNDCTAGPDGNPALSAAAIRIFQVIRALPGTSVRETAVDASRERSGERMQEGVQQEAFTPEQYNYKGIAKRYWGRSLRSERQDKSILIWDSRQNTPDLGSTRESSPFARNIFLLRTKYIIMKCSDHSGRAQHPGTIFRFFERYVSILSALPAPG